MIDRDIKNQELDNAKIVIVKNEKEDYLINVGKLNASLFINNEKVMDGYLNNKNNYFSGYMSNTSKDKLKLLEKMNIFKIISMPFGEDRFILTHCDKYYTTNKLED